MTARRKASTSDREIYVECSELMIGARRWGGLGPRRVWRQRVLRHVGHIGPDGTWMYPLPPGAERIVIRPVRRREPADTTCTDRLGTTRCQLDAGAHEWHEAHFEDGTHQTWKRT